eukprot:703754-Rhodomonas_salina.5
MLQTGVELLREDDCTIALLTTPAHDVLDALGSQHPPHLFCAARVQHHALHCAIVRDRVLAQSLCNQAWVDIFRANAAVILHEQKENPSFVSAWLLGVRPARSAAARR